MMLNSEGVWYWYIVAELLSYVLGFVVVYAIGHVVVQRERERRRLRAEEDSAPSPDASETVEGTPTPKGRRYMKVKRRTTSTERGLHLRRRAASQAAAAIIARVRIGTPCDECRDAEQLCTHAKEEEEEIGGPECEVGEEE